MKFKLTYKVLRKSSIEPGYTFRGVKIYQETPDSHFCFDCEIDGVTILYECLLFIQKT